MGFKLDKRKACPVSKYAQDVVSGKITAGKYVKMACQRHLRDLEDGHKRGIYFDREAAEKAIYFIEQLRHTKGEWGGLRIKLGLWQKFIIGAVFGWKNSETGFRRFKKIIDLIGRKNGKSTIAGGISLKLLTADGEPGAEVYTVATKRDQARIVFEEAKNMVRALPNHYALRKRINVWQNMLQVEKTASKMLPLSSDDKTADGLNPSGAIIDELHAHKSRAMLDVIDTGMGARRQALTVIISTAGFDKNSPCYEERDYAIKVLEGVINDDALFAYIAEIDEGDDPFDENVWSKANPNIGISPKLDYLRQQAKKAREIPSFYNEFMTKHMNLWTETESRWLPDGAWDACSKPVPLDFLKGRPCYGGLDLSSTMDLSAFCKVWPPFEDDPNWYVNCRFWLPEADLRDRIRRDRAPYDVWAREGHITLTPGNVIDHNFIQAQIEDDWDKFEIADVGYDRYNAAMIVTRLGDSGVSMVGFGQGFLSMSPAVKEAERIILKKELAHAGNPVLRWMCSNTVLKRDAAGNVKPDKENATRKIDGIVAMLMAIGRASIGGQIRQSVYETRGVREI